MNTCGLPKDDGKSLSWQGTLDSSVIVQPHVPPFTTVGLLDYIVELVVCKDEVNNTIYYTHRYSNSLIEVHSAACSHIVAHPC